MKLDFTRLLPGRSKLRQQVSIKLGMTNNQELRKAISCITNQYGCLSEKERLSKVHLQIPAIEGLRRKYQHSISLIRQVVPDDVATWKYCCYEYAFNLIDPHRPDIRRDWVGRLISVDSGFAGYLAKTHLRKQDHPRSGCIVIYYSGAGKVEHAGKVVEEDFVESKWGWLGHLWKHRIYELPESYGSGVGFFSSISAEESGRAFETYVRLRQERSSDLLAQTKRSSSSVQSRNLSNTCL